MTSDIILKAMRRIPYGLFVVGSARNGGVSSIIANWITQVSFDPPLMAISIENDSRMLECISASGAFSLNLLPAGSKKTAKAFIKPADSEGNLLNGRPFTLAQNGTPFLSDATTSLACSVVQAYSVGDHTLFVGRVEDAVVHDEGDVLTLRETGWQYRR